MKVLQVVPFITPGSGLGRYVLNLSSILSESGHETAVLTTHTLDPEFEREELKKHGAGCAGQLGSCGKIRMYWKCKRLIESYKPDILIVNYDGTAQFVLPFLKHRPKVVHVLHNNTEDFYRVASINGGLVDGWIAPTRAIADRFNDFTHGKYSAKTIVIPHGVEIPAAEPIKQNSVPQLIFVGVHYEHKGVKILPEIIEKLIERGLEFHFTIVGEGELSRWLHNRLCDQVKKNIVSFTGIITPREVYELLAKADIFVYPTHIDAFGLVIAEAMINGAVPVVTDLKGITDNLIENGNDGYLLAQDDVEEFTNVIERLLKCQEKRSEIKNNARKKALSRFSLSKMSENYNQYIDTFAMNGKIR